MAVGGDGMTLAADWPMTASRQHPSSLVRDRDFLESTEQLLTQGGDSRIVIDPQSGANRYGCAPLPDPAVASFGSSTASLISTSGFAAADRLRRRLLQGADAEDPARS